MLAAAFVAWERRTEQPMLDLSLFRNPRFTAASGSVAISFFALSGFIFLVTQYFQFLKGYGPLSTGVRLLPVAIIRRDRLDPRHQARGAVRHQAGRRLRAVLDGRLLRVGHDHDGHAPATATIAAQMVVLGTGMGLTSAPATEAIMGVVPKAKAGVGSAVNDATRLLGGTLGVAVIGSVYASLYASRLTSALPARIAGHSAARPRTTSVGAALTVAGKLAHAGHPALAAAVHDAASSAFFHGFHAANYVAAGVAAAGAVMALALLPAHPLSRGATSRALVPEQDHVGAEEALPVPSTTG